MWYMYLKLFSSKHLLYVELQVLILLEGVFILHLRAMSSRNMNSSIFLAGLLVWGHWKHIFKLMFNYEKVMCLAHCSLLTCSVGNLTWEVTCLTGKSSHPAQLELDYSLSKRPLYLWLSSRCKKVSDNELLFKRDTNLDFKLWSLNYFFKERFSWIIWGFSFSFSTGCV